MSEIKVWTQEEDLLLKQLCEQSYAKKWNIIARKISAMKGMNPRTGKQCRDRHYASLNIQLNKEWTEEEEISLFKLHKEVGNKWAVVAKHFPGRTDNCVKNHFYSQLRKGLRKINKLIANNLKKEFREFPANVIYKILQAVQDKFKTNSLVNGGVSDLASELLDKILSYSYFDEEYKLQNQGLFRELVHSIYRFTHLYKRKPKKCRRGENKIQEISSKSKQRMVSLHNNKLPEGNKSEEEFWMEEEQSKVVEIKEEQRIEQVLSKQSSLDVISTFQFVDTPQLQYSMNVEDILEDAGVLEERSIISTAELLKRYEEGIFEEQNRREYIFHLSDSQEFYPIDPLQAPLKDDQYLSE